MSFKIVLSLAAFNRPFEAYILTENQKKMYLSELIRESYLTDRIGSMITKIVKRNILTILAIIFLFVACGTSRNLDETSLYDTVWEMEYIESGGTDLSSIFKIDLPHLTFDKEEQRVFGSSGCNGYTASFTLENSSMRFGKPGPSTMMACGKGEAMFKRALRLTNRFDISEDNKLYLYDGETPLLRFKKREE